MACMFVGKTDKIILQKVGGYLAAIWGKIKSALSANSANM